MELKKITQEELDEVIELHEKWLNDEEGGIRLDLSYHDLRYLDFKGADLSEADLSGADLRYVNFRGANLRDVNFRGANFRDVNFRGADFRGVDLRYVNFRGVNFRDVNFRGANFRGADLSEADLSGADLSGVNLEDAGLYKTNLFNAKVDNIIGLTNIGKNNRAVYYFYKCNRVICGCFDDTLEEFEKAVRKKYGFSDIGYNTCITVFEEYYDMFN